LELVAEFVLTATATNTLPQLDGATGRLAISLRDDHPARMGLRPGSQDRRFQPGPTRGRPDRRGRPGIRHGRRWPGGIRELEATRALIIERDQELARPFLSKLRIV
jgi:hypothetical protein